MTSLLALLGSVFAAFGAIRFLAFVPLRVNGPVARYLAASVSDRRSRVFTLADEYGVPDQPKDLRTLVRLPGVGLVYLSFGERILQAGFASTETLCTLLCPRWALGKALAYLRSLEADQQQGERTPVELVATYGLEPIGFIDDVDEPYLEAHEYADIEAAVAECLATNGKLGIILSGSPGSGKTSLVKHLARKFRLPVRLFMFTPDMNNANVTRMFAQLPARSIGLFEDFDAHFHGRSPVASVAASPTLGGSATAPVAQASCGATFDAILGGFDGVYNAYRGVVFILTVNDLDKVDDALKHRPSRFRIIRKLHAPGVAVRRRILGDCFDGAPAGLSLDELLAWRDRRTKAPSDSEAA